MVVCGKTHSYSYYSEDITYDKISHEVGDFMVCVQIAFSSWRQVIQDGRFIGRRCYSTWGEQLGHLNQGIFITIEILIYGFSMTQDWQLCSVDLRLLQVTEAMSAFL